MCESCQNYSDKKCVTFFSIWNIVWGAIFTLACIGGILEIHLGKQKEDLFTEIWTYCGVAMAPFYVLSGILIYFGDKRDGPGLFKLGLIISNPFPIVAFGTIFIPIVHVIALVRLCKYYRERFTAAKNKHQPPTKIAMINQDAAPASYGSRNLSSLGRSLPAK